MFRDYDADQVREVFSTAFPEDFTASAHYSVDLTMRFLPDLLRLARTRSSGDLLVDELNKLAHQWPLSSVGMGDVVDVSIRPIVEDSCLLQLYVDRIIAREDVGRLSDPSVRLAARRAIGIHRHLAPKIADAIDVLEQEKTVP